MLLFIKKAYCKVLSRLSKKNSAMFKNYFRGHCIHFLTVCFLVAFIFNSADFYSSCLNNIKYRKNHSSSLIFIFKKASTVYITLFPLFSYLRLLKFLRQDIAELRHWLQIQNKEFTTDFTN